MVSAAIDGTERGGKNTTPTSYAQKKKEKKEKRKINKNPPKMCTQKKIRRRQEKPHIGPPVLVLLWGWGGSYWAGDERSPWGGGGWDLGEQDPTDTGGSYPELQPHREGRLFPPGGGGKNPI